MTGGEVVAAASGLAELGKRALAEDPDTTAQLVSLGKDSPEMVLAAETRAKKVAVKQHVMLQLWRPFGRMVGVPKEYFETDFMRELAEKLADVPDEELQAPPLNIAGPAIEGLRYALDEPALKEMYLNLLAGASNKGTAATSHPAFAEVIKQLAYDEAAQLDQLFALGVAPLVRVKAQAPAGTEGFNILHHNVIDIVSEQSGEPVELAALGSWVENWVRLGLIDRDFANLYSDLRYYAWIEARPEVLRLREQGRIPDFDRGILRTTDFGRRFAQTVGSFERSLLPSTYRIRPALLPVVPEPVEPPSADEMQSRPSIAADSQSA